MPSPQAPGKPSSGKGVRRKIAFFKPTKMDQAEEARPGGFYKNVKSRLVKQTESNGEGCFAIDLEPGKYSMMVWEEGNWYANSYSTNGTIMEVEVLADQQIIVEFKINHSAFY